MTSPFVFGAMFAVVVTILTWFTAYFVLDQLALGGREMLGNKFVGIVLIGSIAFLINALTYVIAFWMNSSINPVNGDPASIAGQSLRDAMMSVTVTSHLILTYLRTRALFQYSEWKVKFVK